MNNLGYITKSFLNALRTFIISLVIFFVICYIAEVGSGAMDDSGIRTTSHSLVAIKEAFVPSIFIFIISLIIYLIRNYIQTNKTNR
ncbi:MAG: hypothetical protein WCO10_00225 [bacterium]